MNGIWWKSLAVFALAIGVALMRMDELTLMRFFRDLSRAKARNRQLGKENSLVAWGWTWMNLDDDEVLVKHSLSEGEDEGEWMTPEELRMFDGSEGRPLYLAIQGHIFDVSAGSEYYGKGRSYHHFVGRDASRAFCTGCTKDDCLVSSLAGLEEMVRIEADRWLEFYKLHDEYKFIGYLREDPVDRILEQAFVEESLLLDENGQRRTPRALKAMGIRAYQSGRLEDSRFFWRSALVQLGEHRMGKRESKEDTVHRDEHDAMHPDETLRAELLNLLAALAQRQGELYTSVEHYQEALDILNHVLSKTKLKESSLHANILADQSAAFFRLGQVEKAVLGLGEARAVFEQIIAKLPESRRKGLEPLYANTLLNLAFSLKELGSIDDAKATLRELIEVAETFVEKNERRVEMVLQAAQDGLRQLGD